MLSKGVVILGHPRSGTTLLRRLLGAHSRLHGMPETHLLGACARFLDGDETADGLTLSVLTGLHFLGYGDDAVLELSLIHISEPTRPY